MRRREACRRSIGHRDEWGFLVLALPKAFLRIERTLLPDGDVSDNSSAPREIYGPHRFIYDVTILNPPELAGDREDRSARRSGAPDR